MATLNALLNHMQHHNGRENGVSAHRLADLLDTHDRAVRALITEAREAGHAICGTPKDGYFMAATPAELEETCAFLRSRAMHSLHLESQLRRIPLVDLLGQMQFPFTQAQEHQA